MSTFRESALTRNPAWVQMLGLCPLLAITTTVQNGAAMALATAVVLIGSGVSVSLVRPLIPPEIRLPCFVVIIATFTTTVTMLMRAYAYPLYQEMALFVQIIVTNCMILGRIEQVASKSTVGETLIDGLGAAFGFAVALIALGAARELVTTGGLPIAALPPGAFIIAGLLLAMVKATGRESRQETRDFRAAEGGESEPDH